MTNYVKVGDLQVSQLLYEFVNSEALPNTGLNQKKFWEDFSKLIHELSPENKQVVEERESLQKKINKWHRKHQNSFDFEKYKAYLLEIGYLEPKVEEFKVATANVDSEVALQAGPQLVVPVDNARYALNAANARWGSLYDALYGTDVISEDSGAEIGEKYNPIRGRKVVTFSKQFLDEHVALANTTHTKVEKYAVVNGKLSAKLQSGEIVALKDAEKLVGYQGQPEEPTALLFMNNGLHIEVQVDRTHPIGKDDVAGVKDVYLEAALSTLMDFEDFLFNEIPNNHIEFITPRQCVPRLFQ